MESGEIRDTQLSASSSFDMMSVGPQNARCELLFMIDNNLVVLEYSDANSPAEILRSHLMERLNCDLKYLYFVVYG